jgi:predicted Zn-dependent peptidase
MVGDFSPQDMLEQIEKIFGSWPSGPVEEAPDPSLPELPGRRVYLVHLPDSVQTQIAIGNRAITRKHPDWLRLTLANSIYGGAFNSRLVMNIREEKGYTYSPRSGAHPRPPRRCASPAPARLFQHRRGGAQRRGGRHAHRNFL